MPEIRIKDGYLLRQDISLHLHELFAKEGEELANDKDMEEIVASFTEAWKPYERRIMGGMCDAIELEFRQNIIDVYIAPWFKAFSDPLVIGVTRSPDEFVDTLTHELLHRLLTDNTKVDYDIFMLPEWRKLFGESLRSGTVVHIPVHAIHKYIYLEILDEPGRLERDINRPRKSGDSVYVESWAFVEKHGYKSIISSLKDLNNKLAAKPSK